MQVVRVHLKNEARVSLWPGGLAESSAKNLHKGEDSSGCLPDAYVIEVESFSS